MEATGPTGTNPPEETAPLESTGPTGTNPPEETAPLESTGPTSYMAPLYTPEPSVPDVLTFEDLEDNHTKLVEQERTVRDILLSILTTPIVSLKPKFMEWYARGCPFAYPIISIPMERSMLCSDNETRMYLDYITFVSEKNIDEYTTSLQTRVQGMSVSYQYAEGVLHFVVSKA